MHVEECSQAVLARVLPLVDRKRKGLCVDIGVGTFAFYCDLFARLRFQTLAVEPLPNDALRRICSDRRITLIERALSNCDGHATIHIGTYQGSENTNLSSLSSNWWGCSYESRTVPTIRLSSLLHNFRSRAITCLKIDIEGLESVVIEQLTELSSTVLPAIVVFEYGGGSTFQKGEAGWSDQFLGSTLACLRVLQKLDYQMALRIDSSSQSTDTYYELPSMSLEADRLFQSHNIYGNFIVFRNADINRGVLQQICQLYLDNDVNPHPPYLEVKSLKHRFLHKVYRKLFR